MRIISLSVDGIHQAAQRGLYEWLSEQDADIVCLQDLRALEYELDHDIFHPEGYFAYFFDSGVKHYNGVAIYTRYQPKALIYGLGFSSGVDMEGRYLQADFEQFSIGSLLAPSATQEVESADVKAKFFDDFQAHLHKITRSVANICFAVTGKWCIKPPMSKMPATTKTIPGIWATNANGWTNCIDKLVMSMPFVASIKTPTNILGGQAVKSAKVMAGVQTYR